MDLQFKLKTICEALGTDYDEARYLLARGAIPAGVADLPGRGNHRLFSAHQALLLAVVLKAKDAGINGAIATTFADWTPRIQQMAQNLGWDPQFAPLLGSGRSENRWLLEIGDARFVRVSTDANPSVEGLYSTHWVDMRKRREVRAARPAVILQIDLTRLSELLTAAAV